MVIVHPSNATRSPLEMQRVIPREIFKEALCQAAQENGIDITVELDDFVIAEGKLQGVFSTADPCVVLYHPKKRKKYYSLVLEQKSMYGETKLYIHFGGKSENAIVMGLGEGFFTLNGDGFDYHRPNLLGKMMKNRALRDLKEEEMYYHAIHKLVGKATVLAEIMMNGHYTSTPPRQEPVRPASPPRQESPKYQTPRQEPPKYQSSKQEMPKAQPVGQPVRQQPATQKAQSKPIASQKSPAKEKSLSMSDILSGLWFVDAICSTLFVGPKAILVGIIGFVALCIGISLAKKHPLFAGLFMFIGWFLASSVIIMSGSTIGIIAVIVCAILHFLAEWVDE